MHNLSLAQLAALEAEALRKADEFTASNNVEAATVEQTKAEVFAMIAAYLEQGVFAEPVNVRKRAIKGIKYAPRDGTQHYVKVKLPGDVDAELRAQADEQKTSIANLITTPLIPYVRAQAEHRRAAN